MCRLTYDSLSSIMTYTMSTSSLNTLPLSVLKAADAFKTGIVSTLLKFNSIILRFKFPQNYGVMIGCQKTRMWDSVLALSPY